jgi:hypothetical protein
MSDRLELLLADTGRNLAWPESRDLVSAVSDRITAPRRRREWVPRFAFATAAVVLLGAGLLVFSPATRSAVADFLGIGGVRISYGPTQGAEIGATFDLGERMADLGEAGRRAGFDVLAPQHEELGAPDEVWLDEDTPAGPLVALVYGPRPNVPVASGEDASVLFTQFRAPLADDAFFFKKLAPGGTQVTPVRIGEVDGYWLQGDAHLFYYEASDGEIVEESVRMVGNVLLWEQDGFTLRLEVGDMPIALALQIAATVD